MSYIGNPPAEAYTNTVKDSFSGDGSTVAFTLSRPSLTNDVRVVVENVIQDPTVAYSVSGTTLTFTSAPPSGTNNIYVVHLGPAVQTAVPPGEISAATTFASNVTVQGAFTSRGIDDNATSTAMTLDTSGNLFVGKTAISFATVGIENRADGRITSTRSGDTNLVLHRLSSDGSLIDFYKDSTVLGSVKSRSGFSTSYITYPASGSGSGISGTTNAILPTSEAGLAKDNGINLGASSVRFKDLYLSGGVYLGGTGAANYLDDYEEGTWTPSFSFSSGSVGYAQQLGMYVKIGSLVFWNAAIFLNSVSSPSGNVHIAGLPFTNKSGEQYVTGPSYALVRNLANSFNNLMGYNISGDTEVFLSTNATNQSAIGLSATNFTSSTGMYISGTYQAA